MRRKRINPIICLVALSAFMLNFVVVAGGAVMCQEQEGASSIEFSCEHDHCETAVTDDYSAADECINDSCECEDTPLCIEIAPRQENNFVVQIDWAQPITFFCIEPFETVGEVTDSLMLTDRSPPDYDQLLAHIRTIVIIV